VRLIAASPARRRRDYAKKIAVWGTLGAITRGRIAILSLTPPLLKLRLPVIMGAHMAAELAEMRLVPRRSRILLTSILLACLRVGVAPTAGWCDDVLKVAVGAPNNWDGGVPDVGQRAGIFKKHGLILEILYTNGGGETMQAVISGSADLGISAGTGGVFGPFAPGPAAPSRRRRPQQDDPGGACDHRAHR